MTAVLVRPSRLNLFAGWTPRSIHLHHRTAELTCAREEWHRAIRLGHAVDEARWLEICDRLSADLDALEEGEAA